MIVKLFNDFHGTEVRVRVPYLPFSLSEGQTRRARNVLCGIADCTCGDVRGPQEVDVCMALSTGWRLFVKD